jgi:hypothetical protein
MHHNIRGVSTTKNLTKKKSNYITIQHVDINIINVTIQLNPQTDSCFPSQGKEPLCIRYLHINCCQSLTEGKRKKHS